MGLCIIVSTETSTFTVGIHGDNTKMYSVDL